MHPVSRFALVSVLALTLSGAALAAPASKAKTDMTKSAVAKPLSAWLVGPSQASQFDAKDHPEGQGCLMVTEYDNGMIVGIHARKAGIVGMTVDTKQSTLVPGTASNVGFNLGSDAFVMTAMASDASTLSMNLDEAGGGKSVVEHLTNLGNFRLLIDNKPYYFATTGFTDGLARLQACMGGTMAVPIVVTGPGATNGKIKQNLNVQPMQVTSSGKSTPLALAMPNLVPTGYKFVLSDVDPMTPISWQAGDDWTATMTNALAPHGLKMTIDGNVIRITKRTGAVDPVVESDQQANDEFTAPDAKLANPVEMPVGVWGGAKGEDLATVLEAWGLMAGINVKADLQGDLKLPNDIKYEGRFDEAVQKLLGQFGGKNKPIGMFTGVSGDSAGSLDKPRAPTDGNAAANDNAPITLTTPEKAFTPRSASAIRADTSALKKDWAPLKQMAPIPDPANAPKTVSGTKMQPILGVKAPAKGKASGSWQALEGTSLRDVLEQWASQAGVTLVWSTQDNFRLAQTVKKKGKFEDAVIDVLGQFEGQGLRPVAQLNNDPATGAKALIVKSKRP